MAKKTAQPAIRPRRSFDRDFKLQAVQMMLDGYSASSVADNLGLGNTNLLYRWKAELVAEGGVVAETLARCPSRSQPKGTAEYSMQLSHCRNNSRQSSQKRGKEISNVLDEGTMVKWQSSEYVDSKLLPADDLAAYMGGTGHNPLCRNASRGGRPLSNHRGLSV